MENNNEKEEESKELQEAREAWTNDSAFMIAYERALETAKGKDKALIYDPFASRLAGPKGKDLSDEFGAAACKPYQLWPEFHKQWTVVRTKFIDDIMKRILNERGENEVSQFVNLGAGLDTRCFRLECLSNVKAFEVDMEAINSPKTILFTELDMKPLCNQHTLVSADLSVSGALQKELTAAGFDPSIPTIFLAEGLIMYLDPTAQRHFLQELSTIAAPKSTLILNFMQHEQFFPKFKKQDLVQELEAGGWIHLQFNHYGDEVLNYGRFRNDEYKPSIAFSFVVCQKG